jgi:hypothetical protein
VFHTGKDIVRDRRVTEQKLMGEVCVCAEQSTVQYVRLCSRSYVSGSVQGTVSLYVVCLETFSGDQTVLSTI